MDNDSMIDEFDPIKSGSGDSGNKNFDTDSIEGTIDDKPYSGRPALCCSYLEKLDPRFKDLVLWVDPKKSGVILVFLFVFLVSCMSCSFISVVAYFGLALLLVSGALRLYMFVMKKKDAGADKIDFLDKITQPVSIPRDCGAKCSEKAIAELECCINSVKKLLMFEEVSKTAKFFVGLVLLTYLGSWFNLLTLVTLSVVFTFSLPKAYSIYHKEVDQVLFMAFDKYKMVNDKIREVIPFGKKDKSQ